MGRKIIWVSPQLLQQMMTEGWRIPNVQQEAFECTQGLPEGAQFVGGGYDAFRAGVGLVFEHPSWPDTLAGHPYDVLPPVIWQTFRRLDEVAA